MAISSTGAVTAAEPEPQWHQSNWQAPIVAWLKSLKPEDVKTEAKPMPLPELNEIEARRLY
ncbi:MAG: hypothetical protein WCH98_23390, partial [Verrucomicrobiota bacterium]